MPFPSTKAALTEHGYAFLNDQQCKCGVWVEMWSTPRGRTMPLTFRKTETQQEVCEPHFSCPFAADFSERIRTKQAADYSA